MPELLYSQDTYRILGACLLVNFGHYPKLEYRRAVLTDSGRPRSTSMRR